MDNTILLFVYGTLKQGYPCDRYLANSDFLGDVEVNAVNLYDLGYCPALVPNYTVGPLTKKNVAKGELYLVNQKHIEAIDKLEGHPKLYERMRLCWYEISPGRSLPVLSYCWKGTVHGYGRIYDWTKKPSSTLLRL